MAPLMWMVAAMLVVAAVMLVAGIGSPGVWIAVVTAGVAASVIGRNRSHRGAGS